MSMKALLGGMLLAATLALTALPASAATPRQRMMRQHHRIVQGVASGRLTRSEARRLRRQERRMHARMSRERRMHGGAMTMRERVRMQRRMNRESRRIYRRKHNRRRR